MKSSSISIWRLKFETFFFPQDDLPLHGCGWQSFHVTYATEQTHEAPSNPLKAQESWCCFAAFNSTWTSPLPLKRKVNLKIVINLIKSSHLKVWGQIRWYYLGLVHQPGVFQVPLGHSLQFHSVQVRFKGTLRTFLTIDLKPWSFLRSKKGETAGFGEKRLAMRKLTLLGTNISLPKTLLSRWFSIFPFGDVVVPWRLPDWLQQLRMLLPIPQC